MNKLSTALTISRISWLALVACITLTGLAISWKLAIIALLPLLLCYHGPIKGDIRGNQWAAFAVTPYFMYGVTEEVEQWFIPDVAYSAVPTVLWLASSALFIASMMHSRWAAQEKMDAAERA
ncbi:MAG: DUF2069 domain-containing protein [Litorivicinus sp.]